MCFPKHQRQFWVVAEVNMILETIQFSTDQTSKTMMNEADMFFKKYIKTSLVLNIKDNDAICVTIKSLFVYISILSLMLI